MTKRSLVLFVSGLLVAASGGIHLRLYREGYREISVDRVLGIDISRSFALNALAGLLIGSALVAAALGLIRGTVPAVLGLAFSAGAVGGYVLSRTVGLLGFEEDRWLTEAYWAEAVQLGACALLAWWLVALRDEPVTAEART